MAETDPQRPGGRSYDETRCPLCGGDNGCAPVASGSFETPCWCATADFPPELLERIAAADRGRSCLCARCATAAAAARERSGPDDAVPTGTAPGSDRDQETS